MKKAKFHIRESETEDKKPYVVLIAPNGETLNVSELFESQDSPEINIAAVKKYARTAEIVDERSK